MSLQIVVLHQVSKTFGDMQALKSIDLQVPKGELLTLLGPSGCGKTTLLRLIAGFEAPTSGAITIDGRSMVGIPPEKRPVNTVFQSYALFPHMSVFDNVAFGPRIKGLPRKEVEQRVQEALEMVNLTDFARRKPSQLSGGQQQRVAIARAVVNKPLVLLLDEPLNALDFKLRKAMQIELKQVQRQLGITFIFVTHDQDEALSMSDRVVVMNEGRIEQMGTPREIYETPRNHFVARFVGEINILQGSVTGRENERLRIAIEERTIELDCAPGQGFQVGDTVDVLVRPEDLRIWRLDELQPDAPTFAASVREVIYKGTTVDLILGLSSGKQLAASQFFNEDHEQLEFAIGEKVWVDWIPGWEVILPHEG